MPVTSPSVWTEGSLPAILEPYMWVEIVDRQATWPDGKRTTRIVGHVKPPSETVPDFADQRAVNAAARTVREALCKNAEDAITAAEDAGFGLCEHPEIDIGGRMRHDRERDLYIPVAEARVTLWFRMKD